MRVLVTGSRELADLVHPGIEWRGGAEYEGDPYRSLLDIEPAHQLLDWTPGRSWRAFREKGA